MTAMRMTIQVKEVVKSDVLDILKRNPNGLDVVRLYSDLFLRAPGAPPSFRSFCDFLRELRNARELTEVFIPGKLVAYKL